MFFQAIFRSMKNPLAQIFPEQLSNFSLSNSRQHSANVDVIADMKSKITKSRWYFFADMILCATWKGKFETIKIKLEKNPYTQTNMCLLHIARNFKNIFKYKLYSLSLANCKQLRMCNHLYRSQLSDRFFKQILGPISLEFIWSYNDI